MKAKKLTIAIPVYNEEKTIIHLLNEVKKVKFPIETEIIIVEDCSKDNTKEELKKLKKEKKIKIFYHDKNMGKGAAIKTAISHATGDLFIIQDADLEYNPHEIVKLIQFFEKNDFDVVYGSRMLNKENPYSYLTYYLGNKVLNIITNILYFSHITDMETCYKLIPTRIIKEINLKAERFNMEPEITAKIIRKGYRIGEIPIGYKPRSKKEGKKIGWKDGFQAILTLLKYRFSKV